MATRDSSLHGCQGLVPVAQLLLHGRQASYERDSFWAVGLGRGALLGIKDPSVTGRPGNLGSSPGLQQSRLQQPLNCLLQKHASPRSH